MMAEVGKSERQLYNALLLACAILADDSCPRIDFGSNDEAVAAVCDCKNCSVDAEDYDDSADDISFECWGKVLMKKVSE